MQFFIKFIIFITILFTQFFSVYADITVISPLPEAVNDIRLPDISTSTDNTQETS